jgi:hypothetical protein
MSLFCADYDHHIFSSPESNKEKLTAGNKTNDFQAFPF